MEDNKTLGAAILGASASCPVSAKVNVNVQLSGTHTYSITNNSKEDILVNLTCELKDAEGHAFTSTDPISIASGDTESGSLITNLTVGYGTTGPRTITATSKLGAPINQSQSGNCSFQVIH